MYEFLNEEKESHILFLSTNALGNLSKDGKNTFKVNHKYKNTCLPSIRDNITNLLNDSKTVELFFNDVIVNHKFYNFHLKSLDEQANYNNYKDYIKVLKNLLDTDHNNSKVTIESLKLFIRPLQDILKIKEWYQQSKMEHKLNLIDNTILHKHAEMNLLENNEAYQGYIGISKLSCLPCKDIVDQKGVLVRGSHTKQPGSNWTSPKLQDLKIDSSLNKHEGSYTQNATAAIEHHELSDDEEFEKTNIPNLNITLWDLKNLLKALQFGQLNEAINEDKEFKEGDAPTTNKSDKRRMGSSEDENQGDDPHQLKATKHFIGEQVGYKPKQSELNPSYMDNNYGSSAFLMGIDSKGRKV